MVRFMIVYYDVVCAIMVWLVYLPQVPDREHLSVSKLGVDNVSSGAEGACLLDMPPLPLMSCICHTAKDSDCFVGLLLMT